MKTKLKHIPQVAELCNAIEYNSKFAGRHALNNPQKVTAVFPAYLEAIDAIGNERCFRFNNWKFEKIEIKNENKSFI